MSAFQEFGMPLIDVSEEDFTNEGTQYMIGRAPVMFDFLTSLPEQKFETCWNQRMTDESQGFPIHYLSKSSLLEAKRVAGRLQDLADIEEIERLEEP